jgi:hypothetical protein
MASRGKRQTSNTTVRRDNLCRYISCSSDIRDCVVFVQTDPLHNDKRQAILPQLYGACIVISHIIYYGRSLECRHRPGSSTFARRWAALLGECLARQSIAASSNHRHHRKLHRQRPHNSDFALNSRQVTAKESLGQGSGCEMHGDGEADEQSLRFESKQPNEQSKLVLSTKAEGQEEFRQ